MTGARVDPSRGAAEDHTPQRDHFTPPISASFVHTAIHNMLASSFVFLHSTPRRTSPLLMSAVERDSSNSGTSSSIIIEAVNAESLPSVCSFFVEAFWLGSTTADLGPVQADILGDRDCRLLAERMHVDFSDRYGNSFDGRRQLFPSRMLLAKDATTGGIVGCVGVEAAMLNPFAKQICTRVQSEALLRSELNAMSGEEFERYKGLPTARLAAALYPEFQTVGLLTNLAVSPTHRQEGLAKELCELCEQGAADEWGLPAVLLQVEAANAPGLALYQSRGYDELWRDEQAMAVRLTPGQRSLSRTLLLTPHTVDADLLSEQQATVITMAKAVGAA